VESNWVHSALRPPMPYCASPGWLWWWNWWNDRQGKPKYSEKTCPSAALSTTNPKCCPDANPGRRGGKPASNRLSYGTASPRYNLHSVELDRKIVMSSGYEFGMERLWRDSFGRTEDKHEWTSLRIARCRSLHRILFMNRYYLTNAVIKTSLSDSRTNKFAPSLVFLSSKWHCTQDRNCCHILTDPPREVLVPFTYSVALL
jgi:hypothetical protein